MGTIQEQANRPETHRIQLKKGDCFYIFSDGYADQFGGKDNKKYKSSRLQGLLLSLYQLTMKTQSEKMEAEFNTWKGNHEQVDDVLIIGVKA